jgi:hypothetical protein
MPPTITERTTTPPTEHILPCILFYKLGLLLLSISYLCGHFTLAHVYLKAFLACLLVAFDKLGAFPLVSYLLHSFTSQLAIGDVTSE